MARRRWGSGLRVKQWFGLVLAVIVLAPIVWQSQPARAAAGVNPQLNFQARLLNSSGVPMPDGIYNAQFKIYRSGDGILGGGDETLLWTENYQNLVTQGITLTNGYFSIQLGSINPFGAAVDWNNDTLWLSVDFGNTNATCTPIGSCALDGEMSPFKRLSSSPYAFNSSQLGGLTSAQYLQIGQGMQTDASTADGLALNKTAAGNLLHLQSSGVDAFTLSNAGDLSFGANANHTLSVATAATTAAGRNLTLAAGAAGTGASALVGGVLTLQGGAGGGTNGNGGNLVLGGGAANGTGTAGIVSVVGATKIQAAATNASLFTVKDTGGGSLINIDSTATNQVKIGDNTGTGAATTVFTIDGATTTPFAAGNAAMLGSMYYDSTRSQFQCYSNFTGTPDWGDCGTTNLQGSYNHGTNPATVPELKLDTTHSTIDIQDADTTIGANILNVRASNTGSLGTILFGIGNTGQVTTQNTVDQTTAFQVLNSAGNNLVTVNTQSGYVIHNAVKTLGNEITDNPGFEAGGSISNGAQGWNGPAQASIVNDTTNAHGGNYELQVTPNATNIDVYGGTYYEVIPGATVYLEAYVKNSAGANGDGGVQLTFLDKDRANPTYATSYAGTPGTSYVLKTVSAVVPAGKYYVRASAAVRSTATTGTYYFDDFYLRKASERAPVTFKNSVDTTTAFIIQSAGAAQTLFTADTANNVLRVGDATGTDTATTLLVLDSTTADPTTSLASKNGALYYRSDTNSLKAVIGGATYDVCTTAVTCSGYSASASSTVQLQVTTPGAQQTGNINITGAILATSLKTLSTASASTNSANLVIGSGNATGTTSNSGNLTLDIGTATGTLGTIIIGHAGISTTMPGSLAIQGANALALGNSGTAEGKIQLFNSVGANSITIAAPGANPTSSWAFTLPQNPSTSSGYCLKATDTAGTVGFSDCAAGTTVNIQQTYDNSSSPANITLADGKNFQIIAQDTATDPSIVFNLQCTTCSANGGRFAVQNGGADALTVMPNGGGIVLGTNTQIGSATTDANQINFQLDSYNANADSGSCTTTTNQGVMYYNTTMGSIRACVNGSWGDLSNPDTLGLLSFGIVPSSGSNPYDLPSLVVPGASGPCKVSWATSTSVSVQACVAYSGGKRVNVTAVTLNTNNASAPDTNLTTTNIWGHVCLNGGTSSQPAFTATAGNANAKANMPSFSISQPVLCLADVKGSATTAGNISAIYDVRTFTSTSKEAITISTAAELGMLMDASTNGALVPAASSSAKLYGLVVATDGATSTTNPNAIVTTIGPGFVKALSGTAGQFVITSTTAGYAITTASIPNNSFYYSSGNTRTSFSTTCISAATCSGSLYVNFIVR